MSKLGFVLMALLAMFFSSCPDKVIAGPFRLKKADENFLLNLARQTLTWKVKYGEVPKIDPGKLDPRLRSNVACFVTLEKRNTGLRGCIGMFNPPTPLYQNVITRAVAAALYDSRFQRVGPGELKDIKIEVSVLTPPKPLKYKDPKDLLSKLIPLKHGVILTTRKGSSTYLPQVWKQLPNKEMFLSRLCMKHGSLPSCWEQGPDNVKVEIYEALVFGEGEYGRIAVGPKGGKVGPNGAVFSGQSPVEQARGVPALYKKGQKLKPGTRLSPGTILEPGSDVVE
ncbi:MAG: AmmeMemoRadiSam system protein A [Deltaproteobacteria bacterium]|nr:AmmeMemoRadiSam system protein A [Deltaproteobacteria bacterium]